MNIVRLDNNDKIVYTDFRFKKIINSNSVIILAFADEKYIALIHNWYLHIKKCKLDNKTVLCCLDIKTYAFALKHKIPCILYTCSDHYSPDFKYNQRHCLFYTLKVVSDIIQRYNVEIIYSEADIIFLHDCVNDIVQRVNQSKYKTCFISNLCFDMSNSHTRNEGVVIYYNKEVIDCMHDTLFKNNNIEQTVKNVSDISFPLDMSHYTNNTFWNEETVRKQLADSCYMVHYIATVTSKYPFLERQIGNYINTKIYLLKQDGLWLLSD